MKTFRALTLMLVYGVQVVLCVGWDETLSNSSSWMCQVWGATMAVGIIGWFLLRLKEVPTVKIQTHYTVVMGEQVKLKCSVSAFPFIKSVSWQHISPEGQTIQLDIDQQKYTRTKPNHLVINNTSKADEGEYVCTVSDWCWRRRSATTKVMVEGGALTKEDMVHTEILLKHADMVKRLANFFYPKAFYWKNFVTSIGAYLDPAEREGSLHDIVVNLLIKKHIEYGHYKILYDVVNEIDVTASPIIEESELEIKAMRERGTYASNDTPAEVHLKCEGNLNTKLSEHLRSEITDKFQDIEDRLTVKTSKGSIVLTFTISEAKTPHQLSALYLAVTLGNRLQNGKIVLTNESHVPLVLKTTPTVRIPTDSPKDIPTVRLSRRHYRFEEGKDAIVKCIVVDPLETRSLQWFTVKDDGNFHAIFIDNNKYFCGSPKSPSLVISDLNKEDRGIYFCRVGNRAGEADSNMALMEINATVGSTEDLVSSSLNKPVTIAEEPSSSLTSSVTSDIVDLDNLGEMGPKLFNPNKGRARRQKNYQSRWPGVTPKIATSEPLQADKGLDTFFNRQTVKEHFVTAPVAQITCSQSSKSVSDVKVKKEKIQKDAENRILGFKTDQSAKLDKSPDRSKMKAPSPERSSTSGKSGGLFDRNVKEENKVEKPTEFHPDL